MKKKPILITCCAFAIAMTSRSDPSREALEEFVTTMVPSCTLTDGYHCLEVEEDDFLNKNSLAGLIPGPYLLAFDAAYQSMCNLDELTTEQCHLKHYRIGFTESQDSIIILFMPLLLPERVENNRPVGYSTATFGRTVKFWIDRRSNQVTKHIFYK